MQFNTQTHTHTLSPSTPYPNQLYGMTNLNPNIWPFNQAFNLKHNFIIMGT